MKISKSFLDVVLPIRMIGSQLDNEYTEPSKPRISKTVMPENRGDFNDTFTHINREMNKLRFNQ